MADKDKLPISVPHDPKFEAEARAFAHNVHVGEAPAYVWPQPVQPDRTLGDTSKWQRRRGK